MAHLSQVRIYSVTHLPDLPSEPGILESSFPDACVLAQKKNRFSSINQSPFLAQLASRIPIILLIDADDLSHSLQNYLSADGEPSFISLANPDALAVSIAQALKAHQMQQAYQERIDKLQYQGLLLNNVRDAVVVWNLDGAITYLNHAALVQYGFTPTQVIGQPVHQVYLQIFDPPVITPTPENTLYEAEREYKTAQGRRGWVSSRLSILRDFKAARIIGFMDVSRDITAKKQMEAQILAAQTQLAQSARMAAIGELAAGVAHQINNPLTTIIADAQLLQHQLPDGHPGRESIEAIQAAGWRTQTIVQQLADFSQRSSGKLEEVQINRTIQRALNLIGEHIQSSGTKLEIYLTEQLPNLKGFSHELEDLWVNLLLLAREATSHHIGHTIWIESQLLPAHFGETAQIQVMMKDNGIPIPPEFLGDLFVPNFTRPSIGRGTGIELSICSQIVKRHQGSIWADSSPEVGTTFTIRLPVKESL